MFADLTIQGKKHDPEWSINPHCVVDLVRTYQYEDDRRVTLDEPIETGTAVRVIDGQETVVHEVTELKEIVKARLAEALEAAWFHES